MDYPKTRMDNFFAKAAGSELADNSMEPITDREYWINEMAAKIAQGGGGGGGGLFVANNDTETSTLDKTAGEMIEAYESGLHLVICMSLGEGVTGYVHMNVFEVASYEYEGTHYYSFAVYSANESTVLKWEAQSADDYPIGG